MKIPHTVPKLILRAYTKDSSSQDGDTEKTETPRTFWFEKPSADPLAQQCVDLVIKNYTFFTTFTDEINRIGNAKYEAKYQQWQNQMVDYHRKRQNYENKIYEIQLEKARRLKKLKAKRLLNPFATDDDDEDKYSGGLSRFKSLSVLQLQQLHLPKQPQPVEKFIPLKPVLDRLADSDRIEVVDSLDVEDIPLPVAIRTIRDSHYWERASKLRWPQIENDEHGEDWQETYMEKHLFELLEKYECMDDLTLLIEQVDLVSPHVKQLTLNNMIPNCFGTVENFSKIFKPFVPDEELTGEDEGFGQAGFLRQALDIENLHDGEQTEGEEFQDVQRIRDNSHFDLSQIMGRLPFLEKVSLIYELQDIGMDWEARYFDFTDKDVTNLAKALTLAPTVQHFELNRSRMTGQQCTTLIRDGLIKMKNLQILNISYNTIGDVGASAIADLLVNQPKSEEEETLKQKKLYSLSVARNHITDEGGKSLALALSSINCQLTFLDVRLNHIGDEAAKEFGQALMKNKKLINLNLSANRITRSSCQVLSQMIRVNKTLKQLDFSCNDLGEQGGALLVDGICSNDKILKVNIRLANVGFDNEQSVESHMKHNRSKLPFSILDRDYVLISDEQNLKVN